MPRLVKIRPVSAAARVVDALVGIITKTVAKKQDVQLSGFGTFKATKRAARVGKNPRTGEALKIAAATGLDVGSGWRLKQCPLLIPQQQCARSQVEHGGLYAASYGSRQHGLRV